LAQEPARFAAMMASSRIACLQLFPTRPPDLREEAIAIRASEQVPAISIIRHAICIIQNEAHLNLI
jgi:hypothetical protein